MIHRHYYLFLALLLAAHVTGCQSSKPHPADERPGLLYAARSVGVDTMASTNPAAELPMATSTEHHGLLSRLFSKSSTPAPSTNTMVPRKCKGCQFTMVSGDNNKVSQSTVGKKAGPVIAGSDSVDLNNAGPNSQQVTTTGNGNQVDAKKQDTTQQAPGFWATIAKPLGYVGAAAAALAGCYLLYLIWGFLPRRKKDDA